MTDKTIKRRADFADRAIRVYAEFYEGDYETIGDLLGYLLGDLRHWADAHSLDYDEADRMGVWHHSEELLEEAAEQTEGNATND